MTRTRREALVYLLETLEEAACPDHCANERGARSFETEHRMSRMYHEGSYRQLEDALDWLKRQHAAIQLGSERVTGRLLWYHVIGFYRAAYTIRFGCPVCLEIAPPEGLLHRHRDERGITSKVVSQPIRIYQREPWVRTALADAGVDRLLGRMPEYIRVPSAEEAA